MLGSLGEIFIIAVIVLMALGVLLALIGFVVGTAVDSAGGNLKAAVQGGGFVFGILLIVALIIFVF